MTHHLVNYVNVAKKEENAFKYTINEEGEITFHVYADSGRTLSKVKLFSDEYIKNRFYEITDHKRKNETPYHLTQIRAAYYYKKEGTMVQSYFHYRKALNYVKKKEIFLTLDELNLFINYLQ